MSSLSPVTLSTVVASVRAGRAAGRSTRSAVWCRAVPLPLSGSSRRAAADQRGLAAAVRADDADAVAAHDARRECRSACGRRRSCVTPQRVDDLLPDVRRSARASTLPMRRAARRARRAAAFNARTRPSLRVRRALTPLRIHTSSWASFLSNSAACVASASSAAFLHQVIVVVAGPRAQRAPVELDDARREAPQNARSWLTKKSAPANPEIIPSHPIASISR